MIWILLPAYNEEESFPPLVEKLERVMAELQACWRLVVVNDGSRDRTHCILADLEQRLPLDVLTHKLNRGLGETIRDGLEYIAERAHPDDVIIRMDCDDTHEPRYIPSMLAKIDEGYEVVLTSRF